MTDSALLKFEIMGSDDKPTISKPTQGYAEDSDSNKYVSKNLSGKINASDPEGHPLTFSVVDSGSYGELTVDSKTGSWKYR